MNKTYFKLFGDIHNHNAMGYGVGSLERSIDVAQGHLDFFAFTGHSSWHDMKAMESGRETHWLNGFEVLRDGWPKVQDLIAAANRDGEFAAYLGFEWHSSRFGDQCVVFPDDRGRPAPGAVDLRRRPGDFLWPPHRHGLPGHDGGPGRLDHLETPPRPSPAIKQTLSASQSAPVHGPLQSRPADAAIEALSKTETEQKPANPKGQLAKSVDKQLKTLTPNMVVVGRSR